MKTMPRTFTITRARYAKKMCAVRCDSDDSGHKTYEMHLAHEQTRRYSHRENAYIMSKAQVKRFVRACAEWKSERRHRNLN